jgi:hypothetical protein
MTQLLKKHRLALRDTLPMPLDAYYVSLLSERQRGRPAGGGGQAKASLVATLQAGYQSNRYARQHQGQYSGLLYVAACPAKPGAMQREPLAQQPPPDVSAL